MPVDTYTISAVAIRNGSFGADGYRADGNSPSGAAYRCYPHPYGSQTRQRLEPGRYITVQGDAWDAIAYRLWGEERLFMHLVWANPEHLDTLTFPAGVVLQVPPAPERAIKQELPPWM